MTGSAKPRKGLADFLGQALKEPAPTVPAKPSAPAPAPAVEARAPAPEPAPAPVAKVKATEKKPPAEKKPSPKHRVTESVSSEVPLYQRLTRKEVRFRDDQLEALDRLSRRLSRAKRGAGGERITENTLVRVAVDLLLRRADAIAGETEAEILRSASEKK